MSLSGPAECDWTGCTALRREVNRWYVVASDSLGIHIYEWHNAPEGAMENGKHFCGVAHTMQYVSKVMTPDETKADRETTMELKPPLTREGTAPEKEKTERQEGSQDEGLDN